MYERDKVRHPGKTRRDRESGAWAKRLSNRAERNAWCNSSKRGAFPMHTCNGKRTQSIRRSGKGKRIQKPGSK